MGRPSIFSDKTERINGVVTAIGIAKLEEAKARLTALYREVTGEQPPQVSQGDAVEFLARGEANTRAYLKAKRK